MHFLWGENGMLILLHTSREHKPGLYSIPHSLALPHAVTPYHQSIPSLYIAIQSHYTITFSHSIPLLCAIALYYDHSVPLLLFHSSTPSL